LSVSQIRDNARASIATAGIFLAFTVAVLAAILGAKELREAIEKSGQAVGGQDRNPWSLLVFCTS
jgi:hypothetical protein